MTAVAGTDLPVREQRRLPALDGLRGLAALVVVVCHVLMTDPVFERAYFAGADDDASVLVRALGDTPLRALWHGGSAVLVFFVLSGLVLTRAYLGRSTPAREWSAYYPRRLLRLYLPALAALLLAVAVCRAVPVGDSTSWLARHGEPTGVAEIARAALLVQGPADQAVALWSLEWEVFFSLLLPVAVLLAGVVQGRLWWPAVAGCLAVAASSAHLPAAAAIGSVFGLGVLIAARHDELVARGRRLGRAGGAVLTLVVFLAYSSYWLWPTGPLPLHSALQTAGYAGVVALFVAWPGARRIGSSRALQRLGVLSFSLYLVHEPVVVAVASLGPSSLPVKLALAAPAALIAAHLFHAAVEGPSHRLSQRVGRRLRPARAASP